MIFASVTRRSVLAGGLAASVPVSLAVAAPSPELPEEAETFRAAAAGLVRLATRVTATVEAVWNNGQPESPEASETIERSMDMLAAIGRALSVMPAITPDGIRAVEQLSGWQLHVTAPDGEVVQSITPGFFKEVGISARRQAKYLRTGEL